MFLSDAEIQQLIAEPKPLSAGFRQRMRLKPKRGHKERELGFTGQSGSRFQLVLRQSDDNTLDFSVILAYQPPNTTQLFRLRRHNGKSHEHTNKIEGGKFYDFHIHKATARYQNSGFREDAYAEPTTEFADLAGALGCLLKDCAFEFVDDGQGKLF